MNEGYGDIFIPGPSGGSAAGTAAGLALTPVLGPFAPLAGGFLGGLIGGGKPSGSSGGLGDALNAGLGSLFGSSSKSSNVSNQSVSTDQSTAVNVQNVLGERKFGNYDEATGEFDTFQAISDVFAIKTAQDQARLAMPATQTAAPAAASSKPLNFLPLIIAGGLAVVFYLSKKRS